jgi:hypothetical protein
VKFLIRTRLRLDHDRNQISRFKFFASSQQLVPRLWNLEPCLLEKLWIVEQRNRFLFERHRVLFPIDGNRINRGLRKILLGFGSKQIEISARTPPLA